MGPVWEATVTPHFRVSCQTFGLRISGMEVCSVRAVEFYTSGRRHGLIVGASVQRYHLLVPRALMPGEVMVVELVLASGCAVLVGVAFGVA